MRHPFSRVLLAAATVLVLATAQGPPLRILSGEKNEMQIILQVNPPGVGLIPVALSWKPRDDSMDDRGARASGTHYTLHITRAGCSI